MKLKTARRFLARNSWKLAKIKAFVDDWKLLKNSFMKRIAKATKVLKKEKSGFKRKAVS